MDKKESIFFQIIYQKKNEIDYLKNMEERRNEIQLKLDQILTKRNSLMQEVLNCEINKVCLLNFINYFLLLLIKVICLAFNAIDYWIYRIS